MRAPSAAGEDCSPPGGPPASAAAGIASSPLRGPWLAVIGLTERSAVPPHHRERLAARPSRARRHHRSPLRGDETGKVGGTSRPRPRSSTFAPSCRRPPSSFPVARRSGQSSGCHRAQSSSLQSTHHAPRPRPSSGIVRIPMRGNESKGRTSADQCRSIGESIVMHGSESLLRQA